MLCISCTKEIRIEPNLPNPPDALSGSDSSLIRFSLCTAYAREETVTLTKADIENDLYDVNIYFYHTSLKTMQYRYISLNSASKQEDIKLTNGHYEIYAIANWGSKLGPMSREEVKALKLVVTEEGELISGNRMVMAGSFPVTIRSDTTLTIPVRRLAAKATFNISLSPSMRDAKFVHICPENCNGITTLFTDSRLREYGKLTEYAPYYPWGSLISTSISKTYYLPENLQGKNPAIVSPSQKTASKAPLYSTFLNIRIERNRRYIDYRVYLGNNATDDFNLQRNTDYTYNIAILGENPEDLRVSTTSIIFYSATPSSGKGDFEHFNKFVWEKARAFTELVIITDNVDADNIYNVAYTVSGPLVNRWRMEYLIKEGPVADYTRLEENEKLLVHHGNGKSIVWFAFWNGIETKERPKNQFKFSVTDKYGYSKDFTLQTSEEL